MLLLTGLLLLAMLVAACGGTAAEPPAQEAAPTEEVAEEVVEPTEEVMEEASGDCSDEAVLCIGLVTDVGEVDDKSFNQSAWEGAQQAAEALGAAEVNFIETKDAKDYGANIALFADQGYDIIVTVGFAMGEATIEAAGTYPDINFIGVDIKGARIWRGAKTALDENLGNVAFLRTPIERIEQCFGKDEVSDIWITFPDPQPTSRREKKRLTGHAFLYRYHKILQPGGRIHLKTDSAELFAYTLEVLEHLHIQPEIVCEDVHGSLDEIPDMVRSIRTHYEQLFLAKGKNIHYLRFTLPDDLPAPPKKKKKQTQHIPDTIKP